MSNVQIRAPLVNGDLMPYVEFGDTCKSAVELITGDDLRPPPVYVKISVKTEAGKVVTITIPNDDRGQARVMVDESEL
jgi:hypothetical protein